MKPYGYKIKAGCDCLNCRNPNPKSKKSIRHKSKLTIKKELNYDIIDDFEKEYQLRMEQEDEFNKK